VIECLQTDPNSNWWTLWATHLFYQKCTYSYVSYHQEGIHYYCTAHKYSTETLINVSGLIIKFDHFYI